MAIDKQAIEQQVAAYLEANAAKNKGAREEKKAEQQLELLTKELNQPLTVPIDSKLSVVVGIQTEEKTEIDPRKVFELYPDKFWEIVSISKGTAEQILGELGATKCTKARTETKFKVTKVKHK